MRMRLRLVCSPWVAKGREERSEGEMDWVSWRREARAWEEGMSENLEWKSSGACLGRRGGAGGGGLGGREEEMGVKVSAFCGDGNEKESAYSLLE